MQALGRWGAALTVVALSGCLTTSPSREPPVTKLESRVETGEFKQDTFTSQGDFIEKGTKVVLFSGYFADGDLVDELTLFHLAGDTEHRDEVLAYNKQYNVAVMAGWGGSALGAALVAAGGVMFAVLGQDDPEGFLTSQNGQISFGLMTAGGVVLAGAPVAAVYAFMPKRSRTTEGDGRGFSEEHVLSLSDADDAIAQFNRRTSGEEPSTAPSTAPSTSE